MFQHHLKLENRWILRFDFSHAISYFCWWKYFSGREKKRKYFAASLSLFCVALNPKNIGWDILAVAELIRFYRSDSRLFQPPTANEPKTNERHICAFINILFVRTLAPHIWNWSTSLCLDLIPPASIPYLMIHISAFMAMSLVSLLSSTMST